MFDTASAIEHEAIAKRCQSAARRPNKHSTVICHKSSAPRQLPVIRAGPAACTGHSGAVTTSPRSRCPPACSPTTAASAAAPPRFARRPSSRCSAPRRTYLGTSHRQPTVHFTVAALRNGLHELFALPDGYEIMVGNGGSTLFWDAACFSLIERKQPAPFLRRVLVEVRLSGQNHTVPRGPADIESAGPARGRCLVALGDVDVYALTHNETSTGVMMALRRVPASRRLSRWSSSTRPPVPAGCAFDPHNVDVYYFAPQKCFASRWRAMDRRGFTRGGRTHRTYCAIGPMDPGHPRSRSRPSTELS